MSGTATDPDAPGPVEVAVEIDSVGVGSLFASGPGGTFSGVVLPRRGNQVCARAINRKKGDDALLGCSNTEVRVDPIGHLDEVAMTEQGLRVRGWVIDPDTAGPSVVHIHVDGRMRQALTASVDRPDVAAAYPGYGAAHGFEVTLDAPRHTSVCAFGINSGPGTANTNLGCSRDSHAVSVFNLNIEGVHEEYPNDNGTGSTVIPWRERYDRIARWMSATGTVPDVITLQEVWAQKTWAFPLQHDNPQRYETLFTLIALLNARTGADYRVAYLQADFVPQGINQLYAGDALLYNANRVRNTTRLEERDFAPGASNTGVYLRKSFPCGGCALLDGDGRSWVSSYLNPKTGTWMRGPSAAIFELITDPGRHVLVENVHRVADYVDEEDNAHFDGYDAALNKLVDTVWAVWRDRTKLFPPIVAGDFNGGPALAAFEPSVNFDVDYVLIGKSTAYQATYEPAAVWDVTPTDKPNANHCGSIATLLSDHCAVFVQYLPLREQLRPAPVPQTTVPDVRELRRDKAGPDVQAAGLQPRFVGPNSPRAWVRAQTPPAGTTVPRGSTVILSLSESLVP